MKANVRTATMSQIVARMEKKCVFCVHYDGRCKYYKKWERTFQELFETNCPKFLEDIEKKIMGKNW